MSSSKNKNWVNAILWSILVLVLAFICIHLLSYTGISHRWFAKRLQFTVNRSEQILNDYLHTYVVDSSSYDGPSLASQLPDKVDLFLFQRDSLVFWTSNEIEPKLVRKRVALSTDTLLHLGCGDYLFASSNYGDDHLYVYTLLNTDYPLENAFFINRFQSVLGHRSVHFTHGSPPHSYPVYNRQGKLLAHVTIENNDAWGFADPVWLIVCLIVLQICIYLLVFRKLWQNHYHAVPRFSKFSLLPEFSLFILFFAVVFGFPALYRYGFVHGFFIPSSLAVDQIFLLYFLVFLLFLTLLIVIKNQFIRHFSLKNRFWWVIAVYLVLLVLISLVFHLHWLVPVMGLLIFVCFVAFTSFRNLGDVLFMAVQFLLWGVLFTALYHQEYTRFENQQIKALAASLADERDPEFERSYQQFLLEAQNDTSFFTTVRSNDVMEEVAEDYMRTFLFDSVMNQYNVKLTLCDPGAELEVQPEGVITDCMSYFQEKYNSNKGIDLGEGLSFLDYHSLDPSYLAMINLIVNDTVTDLTLFLEFSKPIAPQVFGLPGLLQHGAVKSLPQFSVACYQDSLLVYKNGPYVYPNFLSDFKHQVNEFSYSVKMKHYTLQAGDSKLVMVSVNRRSSEEKTTPFVFFFFFPLVLFLLVYLVVGMNRYRELPNTLSRKLQTMILLTLGIALPLLGLVSVIFMNNQYTEKSRDYHFERTRSLLQDINAEVDFSFLRFPGFKYDLDRILRHYSETFFTDINIYGLDGRLLATTCPEIQDLHLQASLMNAEAFHNMHGERALYYTHDERLGKAVYQSSYIAIQDGMGKTLAYLNTPYFASHSGLRAELVTFVLTYINIILVVIFFVVICVLVASWRVTYPLVQLQEKMGRIDLNKHNALLEWESKDEIGTLVKQYNQLVVELEKSAAELRRTAAESAWRGVARQVAHEIKNSLTPMRLSLQMLQRSIEKGADDVNERVMRTSNTLIEQIDALSEIAASFSTYAKLPENHPQPLDLAELVGNVVQLYDHTENITFVYDYDPDTDFTYNGDKTNLNSAIGNIVKNATQAIGSKTNGHIDVKLTATGEGFQISIRDNGKGIKDEDKKMIFLPNFTTKSGGSGVGLSLAYQIVQSVGGMITFDSEVGVGTEFVIVLPSSVNTGLSQ